MLHCIAVDEEYEICWCSLAHLYSDPEDENQSVLGGCIRKRKPCKSNPIRSVLVLAPLQIQFLFFCRERFCIGIDSI